MSGKTIADQKDLIKESLESFIKMRFPDALLSSIDEILLNYCVSILESLGESGGQDDFDVVGFCELVGGFIPDFLTVPHIEIANWMFELEARLRELRMKGENQTSDKEDNIIGEKLAAMLSPISIEKGKQRQPRTPHTSESSLPGGENTPSRRVYLLSETSDKSSDGSINGDSVNGCDMSDPVYLLQEMFPSASLPELQHCISVAEGDPTRAAQLIIDRQESGQSILSSTAVLQAGIRNKPVNDDEMKSRIIAKYSYVDRDAELREHHPVQPKAEPKKLVRYRDNKIVSLKGERYTEVKKDDQEEPKKKAVVAIKPQRKNQSH